MIDVTTIEDGDNSSAEIENKLLSGPVVREVSEAEIFAGAGSSSSLHPAIPSLVVGDHHLSSSRKNNNTPVMNNPGKVLSAMVGLPGGPSSSTTTAPKQSVVPQLMDIYNDLAQSSTPQTTSSLTTATMTHYQQFHHQQQHQQQQQGASSGGGLAAATTNNTTSSVRDSGIGSSSSQASKGSQSKRRRARSGSTSSSTNNRAHRSNNTTATTKSVNTTKIKSENSFEQQGGGAGKQSSTSSRGKKGKVSSADNRWSKRFTWPDELHRDFVAAIFDVGLKHASPSAIMEFMTPTPELTSERVKSHLQKYRLNRSKSRKEFMTSYDSALEGYQKRAEQAKEEGCEEGLIIDDSGAGLSYGEAAALLTHTALNDPPCQEEEMDDEEEVSPVVERGRNRNPAISNASQVSEGEGAGVLQLPLLTAQENDSLIGRGFGYIVGLYQIYCEQLEESRRQEALSKQEIQSRNQQYDHHSFHSVEQAAENAASMHASDPYMHQVAASIPHASHPSLMDSPAFYDGKHQYSPPQHSQGNIASQDEYGNPIQGGDGYYSGGGGSQSQNQLAYSPLQLPPPSNNGRGDDPQAAAGAVPRFPPLAPGRHPSAPQSISVSSRKYVDQISQLTAHDEFSPSRAYAHPTTVAAQSNSNMTPMDIAISNNPPGRTLLNTHTLQAQKESHDMKQEMRGQMVFQNRMRNLKKEEMSKCGNTNEDEKLSEQQQQQAAAAASSDMTPLPHQLSEEQENDLIWNPEDDDQIFDFLMEHSH